MTKLCLAVGVVLLNTQVPRMVIQTARARRYLSENEEVLQDRFGTMRITAGHITNQNVTMSDRKIIRSTVTVVSALVGHLHGCNPISSAFNPLVWLAMIFC